MGGERIVVMNILYRHIYEKINKGFILKRLSKLNTDLLLRSACAISCFAHEVSSKLSTFISKGKLILFPIE